MLISTFFLGKKFGFREVDDVSQVTQLFGDEGGGKELRFPEGSPTAGSYCSLSSSRQL